MGEVVATYVWIYPCQEGYKTCYILQGRPMLEWNLGSGSGFNFSTFEALQKVLAFSRGYVMYRVSLLACRDVSLFIPDLGYSDLRYLCPCRSAIRSAPQSPCARTTNSIYCQMLIRGLQSVLGNTLVDNSMDLSVPNRKGVLAHRSMIQYILQMLQPGWSE